MALPTMSEKDLHLPLSVTTLARLRDRVNLNQQEAFSTQQSVAVDANIFLGIVTRAGTITNVRATIGAVAGTGESMTVDVQRSRAGGAFATVLTAVVSFPATTPARTVTAGAILTTAAADVQAGDILQAVLDYTAGTPTPIVNTAVSVVIE